MRICALVIVSASLLVAANSPRGEADDAADKEYAKFTGTWTFTSVEASGTKVPIEQFKSTKLVIKGDEFTFSEAGMDTHGKYKVDLSKKPKQIDITFNDGPEKGKAIMGIYMLEGDTYTICLDAMGKGRPTEFATKPDGTNVLEVLTRQKP